MRRVSGYIVTFILIVVFYSTAASAEMEMLYMDGMQLLTEKGKPFTIKSISVDYSQPADVQSLYNMYKELYGMGFNAVRLQLAYYMFEDNENPYVYKETGWEWLNGHLSAARANNMRVILNMHEPQGGYQSWGGGNELWTSPDAQPRLRALWKEIARRYKDDPSVLGYAPLNEPMPFAQDEQSAYLLWQKLAEELVRDIRVADDRHIIFIECFGSWKAENGGMIAIEKSEENNYGFPKLEDSQILYEFHQYWPHDFTHQEGHSPDANMPYTYYPNDYVTVVEDDEWGKTTEESQSFDIWQGNHWQTLSTGMLNIEEEDARYLIPAISIWEMGESGDVWVDEIYVDEYEMDGTYVRNMLYLNFLGPVNFMRYAGSGEVMYVHSGGKEGYGGTLYIRAVRDGGMAVLENARIPVKPGKSYKMTLSMGGSNLPEGCMISPMLILHTGGSSIALNKSALAERLDKVYLYAQKNQMPLFLGEFGTNLNSYANQHGGDRWILDMLDIIKERSLHFNIFTYKDDYFGVYNTDGTVNNLPHRTLTQGLIDNK